jgi:hypothetical protein
MRTDPGVFLKDLHLGSATLFDMNTLAFDKENFSSQEDFVLPALPDKRGRSGAAAGKSRVQQSSTGPPKKRGLSVREPEPRRQSSAAVGVDQLQTLSESAPFSARLSRKQLILRKMKVSL